MIIFLVCNWVCWWIKKNDLERYLRLYWAKISLFQACQTRCVLTKWTTLNSIFISDTCSDLKRFNFREFLYRKWISNQNIYYVGNVYEIIESRWNWAIPNFRWTVHFHHRYSLWIIFWNRVAENVEGQFWILFLGWKNSVRHNLSLHPIFVREQPSANSKVSYWCMRPQNNELPLIDDYDEYGRKPEKKRKRERKGTDLNSEPQP